MKQTIPICLLILIIAISYMIYKKREQFTTTTLPLPTPTSSEKPDIWKNMEENIKNLSDCMLINGTGWGGVMEISENLKSKPQETLKQKLKDNRTFLRDTLSNANNNGNTDCDNYRNKIAYDFDRLVTVIQKRGRIRVQVPISPSGSQELEARLREERLAAIPADGVKIQMEQNQNEMEQKQEEGAPKARVEGEKDEKEKNDDDDDADDKLNLFMFYLLQQEGYINFQLKHDYSNYFNEEYTNIPPDRLVKLRKNLLEYLGVKKQIIQFYQSKEESGTESDTESDRLAELYRNTVDDAGGVFLYTMLKYDILSDPLEKCKCMNIG